MEAWLKIRPSLEVREVIGVRLQLYECMVMLWQASVVVSYLLYNAGTWP